MTDHNLTQVKVPFEGFITPPQIAPKQTNNEVDEKKFREMQQKLKTDAEQKNKQKHELEESEGKKLSIQLTEEKDPTSKKESLYTPQAPSKPFIKKTALSIPIPSKSSSLSYTADPVDGEYLKQDDNFSLNLDDSAPREKASLEKPPIKQPVSSTLDLFYTKKNTPLPSSKEKEQPVNLLNKAEVENPSNTTSKKPLELESPTKTTEQPTLETNSALGKEKPNEKGEEPSLTNDSLLEQKKAAEPQESPPIQNNPIVTDTKANKPQENPFIKGDPIVTNKQVKEPPEAPLIKKDPILTNRQPNELLDKPLVKKEPILMAKKDVEIDPFDQSPNPSPIKKDPILTYKNPLEIDPPEESFDDPLPIPESFINTDPTISLDEKTPLESTQVKEEKPPASKGPALSGEKELAPPTNLVLTTQEPILNETIATKTEKPPQTLKDSPSIEKNSPPVKTEKAPLVDPKDPSIPLPKTMQAKEKTEDQKPLPIKNNAALEAEALKQTLPQIRVAVTDKPIKQEGKESKKIGAKEKTESSEDDLSFQEATSLSSSQNKDMDQEKENKDGLAETPLFAFFPFVSKETSILSIPSPYFTELPLALLAVFERVVGVITVMQSMKNKTETTLTLNSPEFSSSVFFGSQITIIEFANAPKIYNIKFSGSDEAVKLFNKNKESLEKSFENKDFNFKVHLIEIDLLEEPLEIQQQEKQDGEIL